MQLVKRNCNLTTYWFYSLISATCKLHNYCNTSIKRKQKNNIVSVATPTSLDSSVNKLK